MKIGNLVKIIWVDAGNKTNECLKDIKHIIAENMGYFIKEDEYYYYLRFGQYLSDTEEERNIDVTLIPKGCVIKEEVLVK